jgi:hypothetical protein
MRFLLNANAFGLLPVPYGVREISNNRSDKRPLQPRQPERMPTARTGCCFRERMATAAELAVLRLELTQLDGPKV